MISNFNKYKSSLHGYGMELVQNLLGFAGSDGLVANLLQTKGLVAPVVLKQKV